MLADIYGEDSIKNLIDKILDAYKGGDPDVREQWLKDLLLKAKGLVGHASEESTRKRILKSLAMFRAVNSLDKKEPLILTRYELDNLYEIIFAIIKEPLEKVPLFINSRYALVSIVAKWRLECGL